MFQDVVVGVRRKGAEFKIGTKEHFEVLKPPIPTNPHLSHNFCLFLNNDDYHHYTSTSIGSNYNRDAKIIHEKVRNNFCFRDPVLFAASNSSLQMIKDGDTISQWEKYTSTISTRSKATNVSVNAQTSFGFVTTQSKPVLFTVNDDSDGYQFGNVSFIDIGDKKVLDAQTSNYIAGETCCVMNNNDVLLFDKENVMFSTNIEDVNTWDYSPITFVNGPRVACVGFENSINIVDFRKKEINAIPIAAHLPASFIQIDTFRIAAATTSGLQIFDTRFTGKAEDTFTFQFESPVSSLRKTQLGDFTCIFAQCSESSDIVCFPFNNTEYVEPIRPFDTKVARFDYMDSYSLTGMEIISSSIYTQYENQCTLRFDLASNEPTREFFIPVIERMESEVPKDIFKFKPSFNTLKKDSKSGKEVDWDSLFPEFNEYPPSSLLRDNIDPIPNDEEDDPGETNYLTDIEDTLEFSDEYLDSILPVFFQHHVDILKQVKATRENSQKI